MAFDKLVAFQDWVSSAISSAISGMLVSGGALGTPSSGDLSNCTGFPSEDDATVYMASNTTLGASTVNLCNTGSIGASGEKWEITGVALIGNAAAAATVAGVSIHDGTSVIAEGGGVMGWAVAAWPVTSICRAEVTLSGPTTFTLRGTGNQANATAYAVGYGGSNSTATFISARRLA